MTSNPELVYFELLKKEVAKVFRKSHPSCTSPVEDWKGQDIVNFQEELMYAVQGRISEKWFYTHMKSGTENLPRIDMLNLLSKYAGFDSWSDFKFKKRDHVHPEEPLAQPAAPEKKKSSASRLMGMLAIGFGFVSMIIWIIVGTKDTRTYRCCFTDANGKSLVRNHRLEVLLFSENQSPIVTKVDSSGCFSCRSTTGKVRFATRSPYYKGDTVTRVLDEVTQQEEVRLQTNDYALMIHYFSTGNSADWKKRRLQLDDMIAADAKIYQVYDDDTGMELYNKEEFINKLTMPLKSLRDVEVLETQYTSNRISLLRFRQVTKSR